MTRPFLEDSVKVGLFYALLASYRTFGKIEPARQLLLPHLKRANCWLARRDRRRGRYDLRTYPYEATLETTWRCNLTCPMCFREQIPPDRLDFLNEQSIPLEHFKKVADAIFPFVKLVNVSVAGEPLLTPILDEILEILKRHQCKLEIYTNITPLTSDRLIDKILPHTAFLRASMDGATKESFETIREGAKFEPVVAALERFGRKRMELPPEKRCEFHFHVTIQRDNVDELPDLVRLAARVGAHQVSGDHILVFDPALWNLSVADDQDRYRRAYEESVRVGREVGVNVSLRPPRVTPTDPQSPSNGGIARGEGKRVAENPTPPECPYLWSRVFIDYDGTTYACCHPKPPVFPGNPFEDFWSVWNGPEAQRIRRDYLTEQGHPSCHKCHLLLGENNPIVDHSDMSEAKQQPVHV